MKYAQLIATGGSLPKKVITNDVLAQSIDTSNEWIVTRTGIEQRHVQEGDESTLSMAIDAATEALRSADLAPSDIDGCGGHHDADGLHAKCGLSITLHGHATMHGI